MRQKMRRKCKADAARDTMGIQKQMFDPTEICNAQFKTPDTMHFHKMQDGEFQRTSLTLTDFQDTSYDF